MFYREKDTKKCGEGTEQNLLMDMTAKADCASGKFQEVMRLKSILRFMFLGR